MNPDRFRPTVLDHDLESLQGYLGLGMPRESLALAKRLLRRRALTARAFGEVLDAILIQADHLRPWQLRVERAHVRLPALAQKQVRSRMLSFHVALENWQAAARYLPVQSQVLTEVLFTIWTLVELRRDRDLREFYRRLPKGWCKLGLVEGNGAEDESELSTLAEAMACYHARLGHWHSAQRWWKLGTELRPFDVNAWEGLVKLHAARALGVSRRAQTVYAEVDEAALWHEELPHLFPPSRNPPPANAEVRHFRRFERHLGRVVPEKERHRFNAGLP